MCHRVDRLNERGGLVKASPIRNCWEHSRPNATMTEVWGVILSLWASEKEAVMTFRLGVAELPKKRE